MESITFGLQHALNPEGGMIATIPIVKVQMHVIFEPLSHSGGD
jgi:hypothetical protein